MPIKKLEKLNILILFLFFFIINISFSEDSVTEIDNPKFSEKGLDNKQYEIKAKRGLKSENSIKLFEVEGKYRTQDGIWVFIEAEKAIYDQISKIIELEKEIYLFSDNDDKLYADFGKFDIDNDIIELKQNVKHIRNLDIITSDNLTITENFGKLVYQGNVKTKIVRENK